MENSPLVRLPAELRTAIYEFALLEEDNIEVGSPRYSLDIRQIWRVPSVLQTCRQLRYEASVIYYSCNTFKVPGAPFVANSMTVCLEWLWGLGEEGRQLLRRVRLASGYVQREEACHALQKFRCYLSEVALDIDGAVIDVKLRKPGSAADHEWICG